VSPFSAWAWISAAAVVSAQLAWAGPDTDGGSGESAVALAQPLAFKSSVEPKQVKLGEPFIYELAITHAPAQRYELQPPRDFGPLELLEQTRNRVDRKDAAVTTFRLKLALFEVGPRNLPDLAFEVVESERAGRFVAPGAELEGVSTLAKEADAKGAALYDIKPPEEVPVPSYRLIWLALGALSALALGYGAYRFFRQFLANQSLPATAPGPLDVRTFAALDRLREEKLVDSGRFQEFYFRLSEIVRSYLGERYAFEALECTGSELLSALGRTPSSTLPREELARFVTESDLVKFAKAPASFEQCQQALNFGYLLVKQTTESDANRVRVS
jgi:hypothetical protein